ncbi:MAG: hypothetical protein KDA22_09110 [Phycisphaerales bacterium]|nr:hypothetical protein [Phycisphaerales bacterium]
MTQRSARQKKDGPRAAEVVDRRLGLDRRSASSETPTNLERRRGPGRRLSDHLRSAEEGSLTEEQFLFVMAIDAFKRVNGKTFPSWTDVLEVIRKLGYRKTMPSQLNLGGRAADWTERADAPLAPSPQDTPDADGHAEAA